MMAAAMATKSLYWSLYGTGHLVTIADCKHLNAMATTKAIAIAAIKVSSYLVAIAT